MKKLVREPFFHFLLLGALLFVVHSWRATQRSPEAQAARIEITAGTIEWLSAGFTRQWHRAPDADELRGLVTDHIREEVLYREALALGLERNDSIVRRRLAQKMEFLGHDLVSAAEPDEATLRKYFAANSARYAKAARLSFRHIYFSQERRGARLEGDARDALDALRQGANEEAMGDPFLREHEFTNADTQEIATALGREFAEVVATFPEEGWHGPVTSSYGMHLVRVAERTDPQAVAFETVREAVARDLAEERRRAANAEFMARLKERYQVSIDEAALAQAAAPPLQTAQR